MGDNTSLTDALLAEIREEFPCFRLLHKRESRLARGLDALLRIATLGGQRQFLTHYHTVLGYRLYVPDSWQGSSDLERWLVLRHERVHLRQRRRYGFVLFALLYLVPLLPMGLAYGRARLEWEAYTESLRARAEQLGPESLADPELRAELVRRFTGPDYGWMWPFRGRVQQWFDQAREEIERELSTGKLPPERAAE